MSTVLGIRPLTQKGERCVGVTFGLRHGSECTSWLSPGANSSSGRKKNDWIVVPWETMVGAETRAEGWYPGRDTRGRTVDTGLRTTGGPSAYRDHGAE